MRSERAAPGGSEGVAVRFGIVGLGHVGRQQLEAGAVARGCRIVEACDVDPCGRRAVESTKAGAGVRFFDAFDRYLAESTADIVVLATPTATHYELTSQLLEAGRGVLLEKPATRTFGELKLLAAMAARGRICFEVALHAAHGLDVEWLAAARKAGEPIVSGRISGFRQGFFDPYVDAYGVLVPGAASLEGSWLDSGINALSVLARFLPFESLAVREARLTRLPAVGAGSLQASVDIDFPRDAGPGAPARIGTGTIETNWTLGINRKATIFSIDGGEREIVLDHTGEQVLLREAEAGVHLIADLRNGRPRLVNHYVGVFEEAARRFLAGTSALPEAIALHRVLFTADAWVP